MPLLPTMQHIIDNLPVVVFEYTIFPDGSRDFTYLSKGCKEILGIDRELLLQGTYPLQSFIYRDDWENFNLLFEKAASEVVPFKWEGRIFSFGAEIKWIEVSGVPVRLEGGRIGWSGVISDIRQRKELEQQQTESDRRYRTLVESLPLGMGVHQQGKLVYVNEYAAKMMGAENTDQMIGMSVLDFVHPDNKQQVIERTRKVMAGEFLDFAEEKFITLDGRELIVETQAQPFIFNGKPAVQIIVKNITEQKLANETIRKTETLFSELFNSAPMAIVLLKSDGNVERVNHGFETMFGYSISELKGKSLNNFIVPRNLESEGNYVNSMISENRFVRLETYRLRKDGKQISVIIYGVPVHLDEVSLGIFGVYVDITEQKLIEEELTTRNAELDNFVYKVSHDLRAPLSSILGLVNLAQLPGNEDNPLEYFKIIGNKVNQLDGFISEVLTHSKNLKLEVKNERVDFAKIIDSTFRDLNYIEGSEHVVRSVQITGVDLYSDSWRIQEIFRNLISNAIKYRNRENTEHRVAIDIKIDAAEARIIFADNGIGINSSEINKVFEMFYRASEQSIGSGLGLYIVKNAVEKLGGRVSLESELGIGTKFLLVLPNRAHAAQS